MKIQREVRRKLKQSKLKERTAPGDHNYAKQIA